MNDQKGKETFFSYKKISNVIDLSKPKNQQYTTLALTLFILCIFGFFAISPTLSTIAQLRKKIADSKVVLNELQTKNENLDSLNTAYQDLQPDLPTIYAAIPQTPNASLLVGELQRVGQNTQTAIDSIQVDTVAILPIQQALNTTTSFSITINAHGSKDQLDSFIKTLSTLDRLITIDSLSYGGSANTNSYNLTLKGEAYYEQ